MLRRALSLAPLALGFAALFLVALNFLAPTAVAKETADPAPAQPGDTITWVNDVAKAFEKAVAERKPVMICINSVRVDGGKIEPAAKGLREVVYRHPTIVTKSRRFICVFLASTGSSSDYGELRLRFGIDGNITSPQHIFAHPDHKTGNTPLVRKEYWPYGQGDGAVKALADMMDKAYAGFSAREGSPETPKAEGAEGDDAGAEAPMAPDDEAKRKAWIAELLEIVRNGQEDKRREALRSLVTNDKEGDCTTPVIALVAEFEKGKKDKLPHLTDVVRALGVPGLGAAALEMHGLLKHKDDNLRANVAVTLEYIGSAESVGPLQGRATREKVENIANHMYRALGRCGAGDSKARALLLKKAKGSKSELASFGPIVGLAYFEKDAKAARGVEKMLQAMGPPGGGRRGGGRGTMKRALLAWTLAEIGDAKSGKFMREKMLKAMENSQGWWVGAVTAYYEGVARKCEGDKEADAAVDEGLRRTLEFTGGTDKIREEPRKDRDTSKFEPKADWEIAGRQGGFGRGGKGGKK